MAKITNRATMFSVELARKLSELSIRGPLKGYEWAKNGHPPGSHRDCVDVVGRSKLRPLIFVEAELRRGNPESNVAKLWKWAQRHRTGPPFILIQGFSSYYGTSSPKVHRETAEFFGKQMCASLGADRARYFRVKINYMPGPGVTVKGAGRRTKHAYEFAKRVMAIVRRESSSPESRRIAKAATADTNGRKEL